MIDDNLSMSDCPVGRDVTNFFGGKEEDCVGPIGDAWLALCQLMDFFLYCRCPEMFEVGIMLQFLVLCYGLLGDGMKQCSLMSMTCPVHCKLVAVCVSGLQLRVSYCNA